MTDYIGDWGRRVLTKQQISVIDDTVSSLNHPPAQLRWDRETHVVQAVFDEFIVRVTPDGRSEHE